MLNDALKAVGLVCVTGAGRVPPGSLKDPPIDHICVGAALAERARVVETSEGTSATGGRLSDHSGLVVEIRL